MNQADVYSGDTDEPDHGGEESGKVYLFTIRADGEPDVLSRVANLFNVANVAPQSAHLQRDTSQMVHISVKIRLKDSTTADMISRNLAKLTCVISVDVQ